MEFRDKVKRAVEHLISTMPAPCDEPVTMESPYWGLFMGFEHERIHLETSSVLIRQLPIDCVRRPATWTECPLRRTESPASVPSNELVSAAAGVAVLGKPASFPEYGWDNEYGKRVVSVPAFRASKFLVSNAEFLPFVEAMGYTEKRWWVSESGDDEAWRWAQYRNAKHPSFWVASAHPDMAKFASGRPGVPYQKDDGHALAGSARAWKLRTEFDIVDMPWDWPVEVNVHEAKAFMAWKSAQSGGRLLFRLPTEAEYHIMRDDPVPCAPEDGCTTGVGVRAAGASAEITSEAGRAADAALPGAAADFGLTEAAFPRVPRAGGEDDEAARFDVVMQRRCPGNTNMRFLSPNPVDLFAPSGKGFHDTHGNVWEWVEDHFSGLPGYQIHYLYDDFSTPCFDGWHTMLMGGSWVSTGDQASNFARYSFRRHFFQHVGFRYVALPADDVREPYPGCATVANLWEGMGSLARDVADGYLAPAERVKHFYMSLRPLLEGKLFSYHSELAAFAASAAADAGVPPSGRVLHLGCGVGAGSFALARHFERIVAVDNSEPHIRFARLMQHHGEREFESTTEGILTQTLLARAPAGIERGRIAFALADVNALPATIFEADPFDVVVVDALLVRLRQPLHLVKALARLVRPGGVAVISASNDWDPAHTPRNSWLGGFKMNGEDQTTRAMLQYLLRKDFDLVSLSDISRVSIRHQRRINIDVMEVSVWRRHLGEDAEMEAALEASLRDATASSSCTPRPPSSTE
jgi:formylglycine-generating enzyme required for sulfatase activity/SAM-dependent methyltransferase